MPEVVVNCDDAGRMQACPICSAPVSRAVFADHVQGCISPCSSADEWEQTDSPDTPSLAMPNPSHNLNDDQARHNNLNNSTSSNHGLRRRPRVLLLNGDDIKYNASKNQNELELEANTEMRVRKQSGKPGKRRTAPGKRASGKVGGGSNGKNLFAALKPEASPDDALARINDARQSPVESPAEVDAISLPPASAAATPADDEPTSDSCASDEAGDSPVSKTSSASAGLDHGVDDDEEEEHEVVPELYVHVRRMSRGHGIVRAPGAPPRSSSLSVRFDSHPPHVYRYSPQARLKLRHLHLDDLLSLGQDGSSPGLAINPASVQGSSGNTMPLDSHHHDTRLMIASLFLAIFCGLLAAFLSRHDRLLEPLFRHTV